MNYRQHGNTELRLSEIGFGAGDNAGLMISGTLKEQCRVFERALEAGINYVDTAPRYGDTESESNLGRVLKELRVRPIINTKVEIRRGMEDDVAASVVTSVEASLRRLGVDYVDSVQIQNNPAFERSEDWDSKFPPGVPYYNLPTMPLTLADYLGTRGAAEGMRRLREAGKIRIAGLVGDGPDSAVTRAVMASGEFSSLNVQYSLINPSAGRPTPRGLTVPVDNGDLISYAQAHGVGVAIWSPLSRGVLTNQAIADGSRHETAGKAILRDEKAYQRQLDRARSFRFLMRDDRTLGQAAVQFILKHPGVTTVLGGFTAVEHVDEMVNGLKAPPLSEEDMARIELAWRSNLGELSA